MEKNKGLFSFRKHPVGDFPDGKKRRKRKGGRLRRSIGFLLAAALIFNTLPASGLAVSASGREAGLCEHHRSHTSDCGYMEEQPCTHEHTEECYKTVTECVHEHTDECYPKMEESGCITKVLDCHHEHDESCGYKEAQECSYVCEICNGTEPEDTKENTENSEDAGTDTAECICEILCTEDGINGDCPVCGAEGADLSACKGKEQGSVPEIDTREKTEEQEKTGEKVITAWEWIDPEEYLTDGMLALPGASRENPAFMEDVTTLLPEKIQAEVVIVNAAENVEETEEDAETEDAEITLTGWECASYPEDGAYEGAYIFTAFLSEGFVLTEDAAALEVKVELGGAEMLLKGGVSAAYQEASWNGSEVTYTGKTENCTVVESSTEAVTWNAGWYVVNSTVTISEPVTVNGAVNLILADGCTLTAEKGIVVTDGNSLTIYAQSGGTGTLTATGTTDSGNNASAGIGGSIASVDSGAITIHGGMINTTGGGQSGYYGGAGIGGGTLKSGNGGNSGAVIIYGGTVTANSGAGNLAGAGIGGGSGYNGGSCNNITIYGGSITAASTGTGTGGAGIGGGGGLVDGGAGSNIQIYGGTINATGNSQGAGIGGGGAGTGTGTSGDGTVTISGGTVIAVGSKYSAGIGGGGGYKFEYNGNVMSNLIGGTGSVTISGGIVDAKGGAGNSSGNYAGAPIGNGGNASGGTDSTLTGAIVFENGVGTVYGTVTIDKDYTVPDGYTLTIPNGATLSGTGTLSGGGTFIIENLTEDMISVPDIHYTSEDMAEEIKGKATISGKTICGQAFTVDTDDWTLSVTKVSDMEYTATYTNAENVTVSKTVKILPCLHDNGAALTRHEGKAADCTQTGVKEYWDCSVCGKKFSDQDGQTEITDTEIPIAAHTLTHHEKVDADCTQTGNLEYWECSVCKKIFSDKDGQTEITEITIPVTDHTLIHHEGQEATCTAAGNKEYWDCSVCGKKFSDQDGKTEIADADIVIVLLPIYSGFK